MPKLFKPRFSEGKSFSLLSVFGGLAIATGLVFLLGVIAWSGNSGKSSNRSSLQNGPDTVTAQTATLGVNATQDPIFTVQNAGGSAVFTVNTPDSQVILGESNAVTGQLVFAGGGSGNTITIVGQPNATGDRTIVLPNESGTLCTTGSVCSGYAAASDAGNYVQIQGTTPTVQQVGGINVTGTVVARDFSGDGSNITGIDGGNIETGTISDGRLSTNVALLNRTAQIFSGANTFTGTFNAAGALTASGTADFSGASTFGNTVTVTYTDPLAFQIQKADLSSVFTVDTTDGRVGIGTDSPDYTLDVDGDINATESYRINGITICDGDGCLTSSGSGYYIQNVGTTGDQQTGANFNIVSAGSSSVVATLQGAVGQTADLMQVKNSSGVSVFSIGASGDATLSRTSATALLVQNASSVPVFKVNTSSPEVNVGGDLVPLANNTYDLGSASYYWHNVYTDTITANTIAAAGSTISGTTSADFTINSDNPAGDLEDMNLIFFRGGIAANAVLGWDHTNDTFTMNQPLAIQPAVDSADAFTIKDSSGNAFVDVNTQGGAINLWANEPGQMGSQLGLSKNSAALSVTNSSSPISSGFAATNSGAAYLFTTNGDDKYISLTASYASGITISPEYGPGYYAPSSLLTISDVDGNDLLQINPTGATTFKNSVNSTSAFKIQDSSDYNLAVFNTSDNSMDFTSYVVGQGVPSGRLMINSSGANLVGNNYSDNATASVAVTSDTAKVVISSSTSPLPAEGATEVSLTVDGSGGVSISQSYGDIQPSSLLNIKSLAGDSMLQVGSTGATTLKNSVDSASAFKVQNSSGNNFLLVNTSGSSVSLGDTSVASTIQIGNTTGAVAQTINIGNNSTSSSTTNLTLGSATSSSSVVVNCGASASCTFSNNNTSHNTTIGSNFGTSNTSILGGSAAQSIYLLSNGASASIIAQSNVNSTSAFQIQDSAGTSNVFVADTTNTRVGLGASPANALLTIGNTGTSTYAGGIIFGTDTNATLYRASSGVVRTGGQFGASNFRVLCDNCDSIVADQYTSANRLFARTKLTTDAAYRLEVTAGGNIGWGNGTDGIDLNLYRSNTSRLHTDGIFEAAANLYARAGGATEVQIGNVGPSSESGIVFGSSADTNLYRSAASVLTTDDSLRIANSQIIYFRNAADSANLRTVDVDSGNNLNIARDDGISAIQMFGDVQFYDDAASPSMVGSIDPNALYKGTGFDRQSAGTLSIGTSIATAITMGTTSMTGTITIGQSTATNTIQIGSVAGNGNTQTIQIGASATSGSTTSVTLGSGVGSSGTQIQAGTGRIILVGQIKTAQSGTALSGSSLAESGGGTATLGTGSTDTAGSFTTSTTSHTTVTLTFGATMTNAPFCSVTPGNAAAAAIMGSATGMYVTTTATTMVINTAADTSAAQWIYHCFTY